MRLFQKRDYPQHMQRYLDEFTFRSNHLEVVNGMFDLLIGAV